MGSLRIMTWATAPLAFSVCACGPGASDTEGLMKAGDQRACSTNEAKRLLQDRLTLFVKSRKLRKTTSDGKSLSRVGYVFDPIVSEAARPGKIDCVAAAFLSLDGKTPFVSNVVEVSYSLSSNLNQDGGVILSGNFTPAQEMTRLLYENAGFFKAR